MSTKYVVKCLKLDYTGVKGVLLMFTTDIFVVPVRSLSSLLVGFR